MNVKSVQEAVKAAVEQAILADKQGTFGVGGILIDVAGNIIHEMHNNVVMDGLVKDPTAHGERQLIDWYYENRYSKRLPEPYNMVLVTSLDPCAMCTGAILSSGFNLAIISAFDSFAGINYNGKANFPSLQGYAQLIGDAKIMLSYAEIEGTSRVSREASGAYIKMFPQDAKAIEMHTGLLSSTVFEASVGNVSATINKDNIDPKDYKDLALEGPSNWIYQEVVNRFPDAFQYKAPEPGNPDQGIARFIEKASAQDKANGGDGNCVAFLDYFGNLLFCAYGNQKVSPIQTAFMRATRMYAELRYDIAKRGTLDSLKYLCHPKYGTFIYKFKPFVEAKTLMNLGAYGSTMEGEIPNLRQLQYIQEPLNNDELYTFINRMPPFYTDLVKISISKVRNKIGVLDPRD